MEKNGPIAIIDYGMGNLRSVANAFSAIGEKVTVTQSPEEIRRAPAIVLPGVGAFGDGMSNLRRLGLIPLLTEEVLGGGKPYLGICLGMQFLAEESDEGGRHPGLGWIRGAVRRMRPDGVRCKIPHMGWNDLEILRSGGLFAGLPEEPVFYFVHSYHLEVAPAEAEAVTAVCRHGGTVTAALQKGNLFGVQFHPEKSQRVGLQLLKNFVLTARAHAEKTAHPCPDPA